MLQKLFPHPKIQPHTVSRKSLKALVRGGCVHRRHCGWSAWLLRARLTTRGIRPSSDANRPCSPRQPCARYSSGTRSNRYRQTGQPTYIWPRLSTLMAPPRSRRRGGPTRRIQDTTTTRSATPSTTLGPSTRSSRNILEDEPMMENISWGVRVMQKFISRQLGYTHS